MFPSNLYVKALCPVPQNVIVFGDGVFREVLRLGEVIMVGASFNSMSDILIRRGRDPRDAGTQRKGQVRTQRDGSCLQGKERGLRRYLPTN